MRRRSLQLGIVVTLVLIGCSGRSAPPAVVSSVVTSQPPQGGESTTMPTVNPEPPPATVDDVPLRGRTIVLDPGHNGRNADHLAEIGELVDIGNGFKACNTTGTASEDGYLEATFNWELALVTREVLETAGATVILTRASNDGWGPCITERAAIGNRNDADVVISLHADGGPADGRGFHVIHPAPVAGLTDDIAESSHRLADALRRMFPMTGMPIADYVAIDGLAARDDLGGLNLSDVPAVFLEAGNMNNVDDMALLRDPAFHAAAARAIADAVVDFVAGA